MSRRLRTLHGLTALLIAALWLAAPLAETLHASHAHRYCAEHDAIEELGDSALSEGEGVARAGVNSASPGQEPGHEACPLLEADGRRGIVAPRAAGLELTAGGPQRVVAAPAAAHLQVRLLFVAPKLSPPHA